MLNKIRQILSLTIILLSININAMQNEAIDVCKFSEIHAKLTNLNNKKILLQSYIKSAKRNNSTFDIDFVLTNIKSISKKLNYLYEKISQIKDNSKSCEQVISMYENLFDYVYNCLDDYCDKNHTL